MSEIFGRRWVGVPASGTVGVSDLSGKVVASVLLGQCQNPVRRKAHLISTAASIEYRAMKKLSAARARKGFTLLEILVVCVVCAVLVAMILPSLQRPKFPDRVPCMNRLRQIDISILLYGQDYKDKLPTPSSLPDASAVGIVYTNGPLLQYRMLSGYLPNPNVLVCPAETHRSGVTNYNSLTRTNLSYFLNTDASLTNLPNTSILAGDRNLQSNGRPVSPALFVLTTNLDADWTRELHRIGGNIAFADGHVEFSRTTNLNQLVQRQSISTNHLLIP